MNDQTRALFAMVLALIMTSSLIPIAGCGNSSGESTDVSYRESPVLTDLGDGKYVLSNPYLEGFFEITPSGSFDMDDPLSSGLYEVTPMEILFTDDSHATVSKPWDPVDKRNGVSGDFPNVLDKGVVFSASLTKCSPQESLTISMDWKCILEYDEMDGSYYPKLTVDNLKSSGIELDLYDYTRGYSEEELDIITSIQSPNILNYAVGDFDGDGNDEIALHNAYDIIIVDMGYSYQSLYLYVADQYALDHLDGCDNTLYTPVSMAAVDTDSDGIDELLVARAYYEDGVAGREERTILYHIDTGDDVCTPLKLGYHESNGDYLDMIMVSVTGADLNGDGIQEVVIGGYLWNNDRTDSDYTEDWRYMGGELFLAYFDSDTLLTGNPDMRLTVLGDDDGTAENRFSDSSHFSLHNHNSVDTSIYLSDSSDNPTGLCRSVNWCNWTIPLSSVRMESLSEGLSEQVYFNTWFYAIDGDDFIVYQTTEPFPYTSDNNNVACFFMNSGYIWDNTVEGYDGSESFFLSYSSDMESHYDEGMTEWTFVIYDRSEGMEARASYGEDIISFDGRNLTEWGEEDFLPIPILIDCDYDSFYAVLEAQMYTYTDPTVIAFVSAVPYDQGLADVLISGPDSIGSTEFERYTESGTGTEVSTTITAGPTGSLEMWFLEASGEFGIENGTSESHTQTIEFSTAYESAEDSIAMYVIPMDLFIYRVYEPDGNGGLKVSLQAIPHYHDVVDVMVGYETYVEFIEGYNAVMSSFLDDFQAIPVVELFDHVQGDVASYNEIPMDPLASVNVTYFGTGTHSSVSKCVDLSQEIESSVVEGVQLNFDAQIEVLHRIGLGASAELESEEVAITSDVSGMAFTSTLSNGMEPMYIGDSRDAHEVLSQYQMEGNFWAEIRDTSYDSSNLQYIYVGYTVTDYASASAAGSLYPDVYIPDGSDEDDPYNPTGSEVYMLASVPDVGHRADLLADSYVLQISWQGNWYDVNSTNLGIVSHIQDGSVWVEADELVTSDVSSNEVWFRVSGLDHVDYDSFEFRLVAIDPNGSMNPSMPVTAYKDVRVLADSLLYADALHISDESAVIGDVDLSGHGTIALIVNVGMDSDTPLDLLIRNADGTLSTIAKRLTVNYGGYLICLLEAQGNIPEPSEDDDTSMVALMVGVVVAMVVIGIVARNDG